MTLAYLSTAWLTGIALAHWLRPPLALIGLLAILPLAGLLLWMKDPPGRRLAACGLFLLLGSARYTLFLPDLDDPSHIAAYTDRGWVTLRGRVVREPDVRDEYTNLSLAVKRVRIEGQAHQVKGAILVRAPRYPSYEYGDELKVEGMLEKPPVFERFSYRDYLARRGIYGLLRWPRIKLLRRGGGSPLYRALLSFKARAQSTIARILPEPEASLLTGILLGVEAGIPQDVEEAFAATSTTHIIAISGFNIAVLAGMLSIAMRRLAGRRWMVPLTIAGIGAYTILVGADPAVVRAAIMGGLYLLARHFGREGDILTSCLFAALVMTLQNPLVLWDVGFQLSFAATLGLIFYARPFEEAAQDWLSPLLPPGWVDRTLDLLSEALLVTLAAQLTTLPFLLHYFGQLSPVSLLTNGLILPVQPAVMLCGGLATSLGLLWLPLGHILGWVAWLPLTYTIRAVEWTASFPWASVPVRNFGPRWILAWYGALAILTLWFRQSPQSRRAWRGRLQSQVSTGLLLGALLVIAVLIWAAALSLPDGRLHVIFLDVGEGDAIFVQTPHGHQVLIDGGPTPSLLLDGLGRTMPFWDRSLDLMVLTHPDSDHITGLVPTLERYRVGAVIFREMGCEAEVCEHWRRLVEAEGARAYRGEAGLRATFEDGVEMVVLHPGAELIGGTEEGFNNHSIVTHLTYGRASALLSGDIEAEVERRLVAEGTTLRSTVLKAAHHGSCSSTTQGFLDAVDPDIVVISVGAENRFGHPCEEVLKRLDGLPVYRTDEQGTVEVITDGRQVWVETER
ncbi:MAG: DNA internalization-related competence protein ComEC/Rec2 [Chloroflexota bacterium]|nr:DNA internalization-related competence protein ComEC/Rec2 [Chloroflexota bacterium]